MHNLNAASKVQFNAIFQLCVSHLLTMAAEGELFYLEGLPLAGCL